MRADVAKLLVEASAIEMVSESGTAIEVWTISAEGPLVRASAPRLAVAEGRRWAAGWSWMACRTG
jgi:hypothetical protein